MTGDGELPALVSRLLIAFTLEFDNEFEQRMPHRTALFGEGGPAPRLSSSGKPMGRVWLTSQAMWSNGMRFVPAGGVPLGSLEGLGANLAGLERWGYIVVRPGPAAGEKPPPRAEWLVRPTRAGRFAQAVWERLEDAIERRWEQRFGADLVADLRSALTGAIGAPDRVLPLYLPMLQYADGMRTAFVSPSREQLEAAGVAGDPSGLGLSVLLARALLDFTLDYERKSRLSLPVSADILPAIGTDRVRQRDLPLRAGVSKEAVSSVVGFLERHGLATTGPDQDGGRGQSVALTDRGLRAMSAHDDVMRAALESWAGRCGAAQIGLLRDCVLRFRAARDGDAPGLHTLSLGLRPDPDGWRAQGRYRAQTEAVLADPWTALPRHPMVLHRGGFPDGS